MPLFESRRRKRERWRRSAAKPFFDQCDSVHGSAAEDEFVPPDVWYRAEMAAAFEVFMIAGAKDESVHYTGRDPSEVTKRFTKRDLWRSTDPSDASACMYALLGYLVVEATVVREDVVKGDLESVTTPLRAYGKIVGDEPRGTWLMRLAELHAAGHARVKVGGFHMASGTLWAVMIGILNGDYPTLPREDPPSDTALIDLLPGIAPLPPWEVAFWHILSIENMSFFRDGLSSLSPEQRHDEISLLLRG